MTKVSEKLFFEFMKASAVAAGEPVSDAELREMIAEIYGGVAAGEDEAREIIESTRSIMSALLMALLPMPDEVGQAIREVWDSYGDNATLGPVETQEIWKAAIEAILK